MIIKDIETFATKIGKSGRILGLDIGSKNIGIALSDKGQNIATPKLVLKRKTTISCIEFIDKYAKENNIVGIVSGMPLNSHNYETEFSKKIMNFLIVLEKKTNLPIFLNNEYLTSFDAKDILMNKMNIKYKKTKQIIDKIAASCILQDILDKL